MGGRIAERVGVLRPCGAGAGVAPVRDRGISEAVYRVVVSGSIGAILESSRSETGGISGTRHKDEGEGGGERDPMHSGSIGLVEKAHHSNPVFRISSNAQKDGV